MPLLSSFCFRSSTALLLFRRCCIIMRFSANASEPAPETEAEAAGLPDASIIKCDSCKIVCELCKNKTLFKTQQCFHRSARAGTSISVHNAVASRQGRRSDHLAIADTNRWMLSRCACAAWIRILRVEARRPNAGRPVGAVLLQCKRHVFQCKRQHLSHGLKGPLAAHRPADQSRSRCRSARARVRQMAR